MRHWQQSSNRVLAVAAVALALCVVLTRVAAAAPPDHIVRVGVLASVAPNFDPDTNRIAREFTEGLRELGYTLGRNIVVEYRSAKGIPETLPSAAAEIIAAKVDVLLVLGTQPVLTAAKLTTTIPIVMLGTADVVETRLVTSLARPGGNITGLAINAAEIAAKRVQLLKDAVPQLSRIAVLWNGSLRSMTLAFHNIEQASPQLGVTLQSVRVTNSDDFDQAFATIDRGRPEGLVVLYGPLRGNDLPRIVEFVSDRKIPTIFELGQGVRGGGLMEFGPSLFHMARRAAAYVDKIANGADPATLPVEEPSRFELVINLNAAKSMGIEVPHSLLLRADRVIE